MQKKPRILLVDDSKETVDGMKCFLEQKYQVCTACDGLEGLKAFDENEGKPDLVITDLILPMISGIGLISLLKKKSPQTPIIAMTGWGSTSGEQAAEAKADMVLMKPFDIVDLARSVSKLLSEKQ